MPEQPLALSTVASPESSEDDYEMLHAAITDSAHGRWFLQEYARRYRAADTRVLLDAIARLQRSLTASDTREPSRELHAQLLDMAKTVAQARAQLEACTDASRHSEDRAQAIAALLKDLEWRMASLLEPSKAEPVLPLPDHSGHNTLPAPADLYPVVLFVPKPCPDVGLVAEQRESFEAGFAKDDEWHEEKEALSTAWISQLSKPLDEVLADRQTSKTQAASESASKGLGSPPRSAAPLMEPEEPSSDSILDIEQELFAPADPVAESPSGPTALAQGHGAPTVPKMSVESPGPRAAISAQTRLLPNAMRRITHGMPRGAPNDALAALSSMSEEELIALFT
jgi:hypothetical protein